MHSHRTAVAITVVGLGLGVAGCGGGSEGDTPQGETSSKPKGKNTVIMENIQFSPKALSVETGATVTWVNQESIEHNVVAESDPKLKSPTFGEDGTFEYKATKAGTIAYECTIHPGMTGTLTVE